MPSACPSRICQERAPRQIPCVDRPPKTPSIRRQGQIASQLQDSRYVPEMRQLTSGGELDDALVARLAVPLAERLAQLALELAGRRELLDDVRAADELALDEDLWDRRPAGER